MTPAAPLPALDRINLTVAVDARVSLAALGRWLATQGLTLPIARPWPAARLGSACAAMPFIADALIQRVSAVTLAGEPIETVASPRSATGPSLVHALATRPPLLSLVRAQLRVAPAHSEGRARTLKTAAAAAALFVEVMAESRAFGVEARGTTVIALMAPGTASVMGGALARPFAHDGGGAFHQTRGVAPGDASAITAALARGGRVLGAPQMGRVAVADRALSSHAAIPDEPGALAALASALVLGPQRREEAA